MNISIELALVSKLRAYGVKCNAFDGLTTHEQRKENIRAAVHRAPADKQLELSKTFQAAFGEVP